MADNIWRIMSVPLSGPARDIIPVTPSDTEDLPIAASALYIGTGGTLVFIAPTGETRTVPVVSFSIWPCGALRVLATGTTATDIFAMVT